MRIGLDFDNTIVCYDEAFHRLALEHDSIPRELARTKEAVKAHLQAQGKNDFWTELQGLAYGPRMDAATPFLGVEAFIHEALAAEVDLFIVSHRSPRPYSGLDFDLHAAAQGWLKSRDWASKLSRENIFFEATKKDKIRRIGDLKLDFFVDDLAEILTDPEFSPQTQRLLFQPGGSSASSTGLITVKSWSEILNKFRDLWKTNASKKS